MKFSEMVMKLIDNIQLKQTVTKIKRYIDQIRNESGVDSARRWVIELLQNARDVAFDNQKVKVKIVYDDTLNIVTFSHNGRFFRTKDILNIIHQVTSKDKDENSIGQFGTGFMSTYTLSERVKIDGIAHDDENPDLYKMFTVNIDRTKNDSDGIEKSIRDSINDFKRIDDNEELNVSNIDKEAYNTTFTYYLQNNVAKKNAKIGIEDLIYNIKYIFLFSERIDSIEICKVSNNEMSHILYSRESNIEIDFASNINVSTIKRTKDGGNEYFSVIYKKDDENDICVALEVDELNKKSVKKIESGTARIFIDFPLIGSENYHIPFVVNCKKFKPNEERSVIYTSDNESSPNSVENKKLINIAIDLYKDIVNYLNDNNYNNIENALYISEFKDDKGTSKSFAIKNIFMSLLMFFYRLNMIDYDKENNKTCILSKETRILSGSIQNIKKIAKILKNTDYVKFSLTKNNLYKVLKTYIDILNENIELILDDVEYSSFITYDKVSGKHFVLERSFSIYDLAFNSENIINNHLLDKINYVSFLQDIYDSIRDDKECFQYVISHDINIFPIEKYEEYGTYKVNNDILDFDTSNHINLMPFSKIYIDKISDSDLLKIAIPIMGEKTFVNKNMKFQPFNYNNYENMFASVLDKNFNISYDDILKERELTDDILKNYINNKMNIYAINDINSQSEIAQESAMKLASYIDSASNYTSDYEKAGFISFTDEEAINSLRSKRVIANMTRRLSECDKLFKELNINNLEELKNIISGNNNLDDDLKVFDDPMITFEDNFEREMWMRRVGEYGEKQAYDIISSEIENLKKENYNKEIELINENVNEKKQGYDFSILIYDKKLLKDEKFDKNDISDSRIKRKLVEVKCSTKTSIYNNTIRLSNSQFKNAMTNGDDYIIYKLLIDTKGSKEEKDWEVVANFKYSNLLNAINNKTLNIVYPTFTMDTTRYND